MKPAGGRWIRRQRHSLYRRTGGRGGSAKGGRDIKIGLKKRSNFPTIEQRNFSFADCTARLCFNRGIRPKKVASNALSSLFIPFLRLPRSPFHPSLVFPHPAAAGCSKQHLFHAWLISGGGGGRGRCTPLAVVLFLLLLGKQSFSPYAFPSWFPLPSLLRTTPNASHFLLTFIFLSYILST